MTEGEQLVPSTIQHRPMASFLAAATAGDTVYRVAAVLVALLVMSALLATTRGWMNWGGDDALYAMSARDIALGNPYGHTLYVYNALNPIHPAAPPPGLPLMLAPLYAVWGLDWFVFKAACVGAFGLFLLVLAGIARKWVAPVPALLSVVLIGLHPYTWGLKEFFPPELPFMLFAYAALWLTERYAATGNRKIAAAFVVAIAVCTAAAYLLRPIGIVLFPAIALAALCRTRSVLNTGTAATLVGFALAWCVQQRYHPDLGTYVSYLHSFGLHSILSNIHAYKVAFRHFLEDLAYARTGGEILLMVFAGAVIITGFVIRARQRMRAYEWFTLGYSAFLLLYPVSLEPDRYSCPLWPLILLYALTGCAWVGERIGGRWLRHAPVALFVGVLLMNFGTTYHRIELNKRHDMARAVEADSIYGYMKQNLPTDAVVIAQQPTVVALVANRRSAIWPADFDDPQLRDYMGSIHAQYVLQDMDDRARRAGEEDVLGSFVSRNPNALHLVYARGSFKLYRAGS